MGTENRASRGILSIIIVLCWLFGIVSVYYIVHKPFTVSNLSAGGQAFAGWLGAALVVALGIGIGVLFLQRSDLAPVERLVWAAALGLGIVSLVGLGLGAVGLLRPWLLWLLTLTGLAIVGRPLWQALRAAWTDTVWRPLGRFEAFLAVYCGIMLVVALVWSLTPPTAWDGLVYHLTGPKLYLQNGHISHPLDLPYLGFPQLMEILFAWGMGLTGERAAGPIHWFYGLLATLALVTCGRRWFSSMAGWTAAAILLSASSVVLLAGWAYVDLALLLYSTLAFLALMRWSEGGLPARRWLVLSSVLAGLALSTKYTALALLPALGLTALVVQWSDFKSHISNAGSQRVRLKFDVLYLVLGLVIWSPWLVKNLALTGNPIYPFLFRGVYWDAWRAWWYDRPGTGLLYTAPWKLITAPWDATVWSIEGGLGYSATIGPLFLAFWPILVLTWRRLNPGQHLWLKAALAFSGVLYAFWLWGIARSALLIQTRLLFPAFGLLALVAGTAVEGLQVLPRRPVDVGWLARVIIVGVLALMLVETGLGLARDRPFPVLVGYESRDDFLARRLGWYYPAMQYLSTELPRGSVVLFLWEPRSYYCRGAVACLPDALLDRWLHTTHLYGADASAIASSWRKQGVTHVLLYRLGYQLIREAEFDPLTEADIAALDNLQARDLTPIESFADAYELYALTSP